MNKIEQWQLSCEPTSMGAWNGEVTVTFDRHDLEIICRALSCAEYEGSIDEYEEHHILDKLNIEHLY